MAGDEWSVRSLAINGAIRNCIAERIHRGGVPLDQGLLIILTVAFTLFNLPPETTARAAAAAREIIRRRPVRIYGLTL